MRMHQLARATALSASATTRRLTGSRTAGADPDPVCRRLSGHLHRTDGSETSRSWATPGRDAARERALTDAHHSRADPVGIGSANAKAQIGDTSSCN
jgi:hypothetical protein